MDSLPIVVDSLSHHSPCPADLLPIADLTPSDTDRRSLLVSSWTVSAVDDCRLRPLLISRHMDTGITVTTVVPVGENHEWGTGGASPPGIWSGGR